jgi:hypothetical protein
MREFLSVDDIVMMLPKIYKNLSKTIVVVLVQITAKITILPNKTKDLKL